MNESEYNEQLDELMYAIEDAIEDNELDIDYETANGILTLTCENGTQVILSRQTAMLQLWVAAKSGGFHFDYDDAVEQWLCNSNGEELFAALNRCLSEQSGDDITLDV